eukprot:6079591-Ditylum_brightwellii.AAC.1
MDNYTKDFLKELQHKEEDPLPVSEKFGWKDVRQGFKLWREKTATSPLGSENKCAQISSSNVSTTERLVTVHNLFMLKEVGNHMISRLCTIHKLDAELNLLRRLFIAHRPMKGAETNNFIVDDQYGGQAGRMAIDPVMITTTT